MGSWWSDASPSDSEEVTHVTTHNPFRYPPKGGSLLIFTKGKENIEVIRSS